MTQISRDDVLKLASLSSLQLTEEEVEALQTDLAAILKYVEQLDDLDTEGVVPAYQVTGLENILREDEVKTDGITRESLLGLAADATDTQIKVPKVL